VRWVSVVLVDLSVVVTGTVLYILIIVLMVRPNGYWGDYFGLVTLCSMVSFAYSFLCVEVTTSAQSAMLFYGICLALSIWLSGYSAQRADLLYWLRWAPGWNYLYYGTGQLMYAEFKDYDTDQIGEDKGYVVLGLYGYDNMNRTESYTALVSNFFVVIVFVLLVIVSLPYLSQRTIKTKKVRSTQEKRPQSFQIERPVSGMESRIGAPLVEPIAKHPNKRGSFDVLISEIKDSASTLNIVPS
jgi:hypothetical protein